MDRGGSGLYARLIAEGERMSTRHPVEIVEVGPRDGLQSEPGVLPTATKVEFIERAIAAGVRRIEVTSFVNPKKVPQMADAEEVLKALPRRDGVHYVGLVLNRKGFDRAAAAGCNEIGMAVVASDTFNRRNQGVSTEESIAAWLEIAAAAQQAGIRPQVTISAAFGCPFEGEVAPERVIEVARRVAEARPFEIALADTIGVGVPAQVTELVSRVREAVPGVRLRCHFHNTRNTGLANAFAAVQAGVSTLDSSLGGIGGCPFAPAATGNIPTEDLVYMLHRSGYDTGIDLDRAIETGKWLQEQLGRPVPGMLVKAGAFPRPVAPAA
jgi:hydroxymethylglutaryl-CoA lyase